MTEIRKSPTLNIYCKGAPLYDPVGVCIVDSCTDRVRDTTGERGIPVLLGGREIGRAGQFTRVTVEGESLVKYVAVLAKEMETASLVPVGDGFLGTIEGVMWVNGLYPQKVRLAVAVSSMM